MSLSLCVLYRYVYRVCWIDDVYPSIGIYFSFDFLFSMPVSMYIYIYICTLIQKSYIYIYIYISRVCRSIGHRIFCIRNQNKTWMAMYSITSCGLSRALSVSSICDNALKCSYLSIYIFLYIYIISYIKDLYKHIFFFLDIRGCPFRSFGSNH
jgi:hypothetical protein